MNTKVKKKPKFEMIPCVDASDMPDEIIEWCGEKEFSTHCHNSVAICHDESVFTKWCESIGIEPDTTAPDYWKEEWGKYYRLIVAIIGT